MNNDQPLHYDDVRMGAIASQITSLAIVYSAFYSGVDQRKHQSSASLPFVWGIHRDRWIPRTKGQLRGKCFHLMTSSWSAISARGAALGPASLRLRTSQFKDVINNTNFKSVKCTFWGVQVVQTKLGAHTLQNIHFKRCFNLNKLWQRKGVPVELQLAGARNPVQSSSERAVIVTSEPTQTAANLGSPKTV